MKVKKGASLYGLHPMMQIANVEAASIWDDFGQELVITAGGEIRSGGFSLHSNFRACDYRTRYFPNINVTHQVADRLRSALGGDYDVVVESDHIHCEYDPVNPKLI